MNKIADDMQIFEVGDMIYGNDLSDVLENTPEEIIDILEHGVAGFEYITFSSNFYNEWIDFDKTLKAMGYIGIIKNIDGTFKKIKVDDCVLRDAEWIYKIENINKKEDVTKELFLPSKLTIEPIKNGGIGIKENEIDVTEEVRKQWETMDIPEVTNQESLEELRKTIEIKEQYIIKLKAITKARDEVIIKNDEIIKKLEGELKNREETINRNIEKNHKLHNKILKLKKQKKNLLKKLIKILSDK